MNFMSMVGSAGQAGIEAWGARTAAEDQEIAMDKARATTNEYYRQARQDIEPQTRIGGSYLEDLGQGVRSGQFAVQPYQAYQSQEQQPGAPTSAQYGNQPGAYQAPEFNYQASPGYQFQLQQGNQAVQANAAAGGGYLSGATQKALAKYGVGLAAQDYNNMFNQYANQRNFGYDVYKGNLGQYNVNRENAQNMYLNQLGQYNRNREFGAGQSLNAYQAANQQATQQYGRYGDLANIGVAAQNNMAGMRLGQGSTLGSLDLALGNVNAQKRLGMAKAISGGIGGFFGSGQGGGQQGGGGGGGMNLGSMFGGGQQQGTTGDYGAGSEVNTSSTGDGG